MWFPFCDRWWSSCCSEPIAGRVNCEHEYINASYVDIRPSIKIRMYHWFIVTSTHRAILNARSTLLPKVSPSCIRWYISMVFKLYGLPPNHCHWLLVAGVAGRDLHSCHSSQCCDSRSVSGSGQAKSPRSTVPSRSPSQTSRCLQTTPSNSCLLLWVKLYSMIE